MMLPVTPHELDCSATVRRLWDYLDARLGPVHRSEVTAHLARCAECAEHFAFAQRLLVAVRDAFPPPEAPGGLRERVRAQLAAERARTR